eukprot:353839-Chlamydomonas_euryale.AAC.46
MRPDPVTPARRATAAISRGNERHPRQLASRPHARGFKGRERESERSPFINRRRSSYRAVRRPDPHCHASMKHN